MAVNQYRCLLLCLLTLLGTVALRADVTGSISGVVHDNTGAVIPGAHIAVTNLDNAQRLETTADARGQYTFPVLTPGPYKIVATAPGFDQATINGIDLKVNDQLSYTLTLSIGSVQQNVSVDADTLQVQTESTQLGSTLESKQILSMPLNGRSFLDLFALQAGVAPVTSGTVPADRSVSGLFANAGNLSVDGQPESANAFLINGADVSETKDMGAGLIPNLDSIQEFRLITNSFDAEYGKFTGAVMNTITKSGTNSIHGTFFEFLRNSDMDARNYFDTSKATLHRNQFGYAAGGPAIKDKLFWFTDYQGTRQVQGASTGLIQVMSDPERAGIFSPSALTGSVSGAGWAQVLSQRLGYAVTSGEPYSQVFPNGVIPQSGFDPVAMNELKNIPLPNVDPSTGLYSNSTNKDSVLDTNLGERVDFLNQKTGNWSFYYHYDDAAALNAIAPQANGVGAAPVPGFPTTQPSRNQLIMISDTKQIGASMVNVARGSYFRTAVHTAQPSASTTQSLSSFGFTTGPGSLGIVPSGPAGYEQSMPPDNFNNFSVGNNWLNTFQADNNWMLSDVVSKIMGNHSLNVGGEYRSYQLNVRNICGPNGYFDFDGNETGLDYADFILGAPQEYVQCTVQYLNNRAKYYGGFVQDTYKAAPDLTFNLGLRYEVATPWSDAAGQLSTITPGVQSVKFPTAPLGYLVPGDPGVPSTISPTRYDNFAPRIGVAWSPSGDSGIAKTLLGGPGETSVRAAFGIYYLGAGDIGNFGVIGDAPWGLFWQSTAPPLLDTPFQTRSDLASQGQRFPFTFPSSGGTHPGFNFAQFLPLFAPGYFTKNKLTYAEHYNLTIQRQLSKTTVLTMSYVGTQGRRLQLSYNLLVGSGALCKQLAAEGATPTCGPGGETTIYTPPNGGAVYGTMLGVPSPGTSAQLKNQALGPQFGEVAYGAVQNNSNIGTSNYNALQVTVERRASDLTFLAAYTYGKSFDNVNTTYNVLNPQESYVISPFDLTQNLVVSYAWNIPFNRFFSGLPQRLTQGWAVTGITRFATGFPITLTQSGDLSLTNIGLDYPNVVGPVVKENPRTLNHLYFSPSSFSSEQLGMTGDAPARYFHGPGTINTDAGFMKNTKITESASLALRVESFNVFNHANFQSTDITGNFSSSQFGQATNTLAARIGQVSAKFSF